MSHGFQNPRPGQCLIVKAEQKTESLGKIPTLNTKHQQNQQQHEQHRHQYPHRNTEPTGYAANHHQKGQNHEDCLPQNQRFRVGQQICKNNGNLIGTGALESTTGHLPNVIERPPGNHRIIGKNHQPGRDTQPPYRVPVPFQTRLCGQATHRIDRTLSAPPTQHDLRHHDGDSYQ